MKSDLKDLNDYLAGFVTPERAEKIHRVLDLRHRYFTVVLEDIFQPHNASAVLRSCDAFGVQDVHIIENRNSYRINPDVELGTAQWLNLHRYSAREDNTPRALEALKRAGYRIVATAPHSNDCLLEEFDLEKGPAAIMFGTELSGLSETAMELADEFIRIPMHGFVESFNISVSAAITLASLDRKLRNSGLPWQLSDDEREEIRHRWLRASIKKADVLEKEFRKTRPDNADPASRPVTLTGTPGQAANPSGTAQPGETSPPGESAAPGESAPTGGEGLRRKKAELRSAFREKLARLDREQRQREDARLHSLLTALPQWDAARDILAYVPMDEEPGIIPILEQAYGEGKRVYIPLIKKGGLIFRRWPRVRMDELVSGAFGIYIPDEEKCSPPEYWSNELGPLTLGIIPGLGFSRDGRRLGRGAGYYDRFLENSRLMFRAALCYSVQLAEEIPVGRKDMRVDTVLSGG